MKPVVLSPRPKRKKRRLWKGLLVVLFSTGLTTLAIHASDRFEIPTAGLFASVGSSGPAAHCPEEMVYIPEAGGGFCIDRYEASAGVHCAHADPRNQFDTEANLHDPLCVPVSVAGARPWVNVPEHEALALCAKAGKRLPSNGEWYRAALGTPEDTKGAQSTCALDHVGASAADATGAHPECVSSYGVFDMIGNVWEWVDGTVVDGVYDDRVLPGEGFITGADADGVATAVGTSSDPAFGQDYLYVLPTGVQGIFRGGFYAMKEKAGIFTVNAANPTTFIGNAVGFRCAREAQ